jgi:menaquinone-9 beta-reductase
LKKVIIIGGGLAGLTAAILLARKGFPVSLIEKKRYPFHRVCGEYISNEVVPFLKTHDLYPAQFNPPIISRFQLSSISGRNEILPLEMGGFGISRFSFDNFLFGKALEAGVQIQTGVAVDNVEFLGQTFRVDYDHKTFAADVVLGSYGKRSNLDLRFTREFTQQRSPYVGVKYHVEYQHPEDLVALHNFPGGYCGVSPVEDRIVNVCYLVHREKLKEAKSIDLLEKNVLSINPFLKDLFRNANVLFKKPEVINEISFERKSAVENHLLMLGDAAGLITPLCGNGMAMAIHSAAIAAENVSLFLEAKISRNEMETNYQEQWQKKFSWRLFRGRQVQRLFGSEVASALAIRIALYFRPLAMSIIRGTHGKPFT